MCVLGAPPISFPSGISPQMGEIGGLSDIGASPEGGGQGQEGHVYLSGYY